MLGLTKLEVPNASFEGRDLTRPLLGGGKPDRSHAMYFLRQPANENATTAYGTPHQGPMWAVQANGWKYIEAVEENRRELYNLETDPGERKNIFADHPKVAARLKQRLDVWVGKGEFELPAETKTLPREQHEALRALGYVD